MKLGKMTSVEIFAYGDVINHTIDTLIKSGNHIMTVQAYGGLTFEEGNKLLKRVKDHLHYYSELRNELNQEISDRIKVNFNLTKSPIEIDKMLMKMSDDYQVLNEDIDKLRKEYEIKKAEENQNKELKKGKVKPLKAVEHKKSGGKET